MAASPVAREVQARDGPPNWDGWLDAVNGHAPGQQDDAVARVAPWSRGELESMLATLSGQTAADRLRIIERALVLHVDVAILHRTPDGYRLPSGANTLRVVRDGRDVGQTAGTVQWEFARRLVDRAPQGNDRRRVGRRFYHATAALLQLWGEYPELTTHLTAGRRFLGDDPVLLLYEGTLRQAYAGPKVQRFFDEQRRSPEWQPKLPVGNKASLRDLPTLPTALPSVGGSRTQAEQAFRRALAIDPTQTESRVRLAHVLGDAGRHDEAAAALAHVQVDHLPPFLDYYASIVTGREARTRGQPEVARAAFERAATIYPNAPAPRYGLSELALARGDRVESLAHLQRGAAASRVDADEPWRWLDRAHDPSAETLIAELHRSVPQ
jgi:tetratricopeptide (TPR) repeat protein